MDQERFWLLISRKLAGEASESDLAELARIAESDGMLKAKYDALHAYWHQNSSSDELDSDAAFEKTLSRIDVPASSAFHSVATFSPNRRLSIQLIAWTLRTAAVLVLGLGIGFLIYQINAGQLWWAEADFVEKQNGKGAQSKITLPDGSVVWLNADSRIRYTKNFTQKRDVYLSGEAFFEVTRNPESPFVIHLQNSAIRVLGTSFNVKAYEDEETVETAVVTGTVAFIPTNTPAPNIQPDTLLLTPNVKAVYSRKTGKLVKESTNTDTDKAWLEGKMVFKAMRFDEISKILERTYGKPIQFSNQALKNCRLTATFQNDTLEEVMFFLAKTKGFQYKISNDKVTIAGEGCPDEKAIEPNTEKTNANSQ